MPIYEYHCDDCQQLFEQWQKTYDPQETVDCPICKGIGHKVISNTSFVLKGGGWYVTDYGNRKHDSAKEASSLGATSAGDAAPVAAASAPASSSGNCSASAVSAPASSSGNCSASAAPGSPGKAATGSASSSANQA